MELLFLHSSSYSAKMVVNTFLLTCRRCVRRTRRWRFWWIRWGTYCGMSTLCWRWGNDSIFLFFLFFFGPFLEKRPSQRAMNSEWRGKCWIPTHNSAGTSRLGPCQLRSWCRFLWVVLLGAVLLLPNNNRLIAQTWASRINLFVWGSGFCLPVFHHLCVKISTWDTVYVMSRCLQSLKSNRFPKAPWCCFGARSRLDSRLSSPQARLICDLLDCSSTICQWWELWVWMQTSFLCS